MLILSSFNMNEEYMTCFIQKIKKLKPKYIYTYPSAITILARYIKTNNFDIFPDLEKIICHAETLYDWQRNLIESTFKCKIHEHYGLREQTVMGGTCDHSDFYHIFPEYGILELVDKNGNHLTKENQIGEIVGTGFHTNIFPFIRYKTGDLGIKTNKKCSCGRNYPLIKRIEGRLQDFVISKNKKLVPFTRLHHLVAESTNNVKECQFYQDTEGLITLNIIKSKNYSNYDTHRIEKEFNKIFENEFKLEIQFVNQISRTKRGKYRFLIQKLPIKLEQ
jgi:phenylacetate-CoA ligase